MIVTGRAADGTPTIQITATRPLVYLDHWAIRRFADDARLQERFLAHVGDGRGSLALSMVNSMELGHQGAGASMDRVRAFLAAVGRAFCLLHATQEDVVAGITEHRVPEDVAVLDSSTASSFATWTGGVGADLTASRFVDWSLQGVTEASEVVYEAKRRLHAALLAMQARHAATGLYPPFREPHRAITYVWTRLLIELLREGGPFDENDGLDLQHAAVPLTACDFVLLDRRWTDLAQRVRRPERRAEVFSGRKGQIEAFLSALERWPSPPPEAK